MPTMSTISLPTASLPHPPARAPNARASTDVDTHVGLRVKMRRLELGLSQDCVARQLGITPQQLQKYERGTNRIGASRLFEISLILEVPIQYFFENSSAPTPDCEQPGRPMDSHIVEALEDASTVRLLRQFSLVRNEQLKNRVIKLVETVITDD